MIVIKCGQDGEVEDLPSSHNPHRKGWQALTSPDVERATEACWKDGQTVMKLFSQRYTGVITLAPTFLPDKKELLGMT